MYISKIKKIAPETDKAATNKAAITVALRGAKSPKVMKITASQKTGITSMGPETEPTPCSYINQRVCARPITIFNAWPWSERCLSSFGDSS